MKLNKENLQRAFLGALLGVACLYVYFSMMLGPLSDREKLASTEIVGLEPQIKEAKSQINRTKAVEAQDPNAAAAKEIFAVMKSSIPEEPAIAWYQPKLTEFFKRQGISKATCRWLSDTAEPDLPGYKSCSWSIDLPRIEFSSLGIALAGLENEQGLLQINNLQIEAAPVPDVVDQHAQLTISTIVKELKQ